MRDGSEQPAVPTLYYVSYNDNTALTTALAESGTPAAPGAADGPKLVE